MSKYKITKNDYSIGRTTYTKATYEETLNKAQQVTDAFYSPDNVNKRSWLNASPPDSYSNPDYRVTVYVLEGSEPKGYILTTPRFITAFDLDGDIIRRWRGDFKNK